MRRYLGAFGQRKGRWIGFQVAPGFFLGWICLLDLLEKSDFSVGIWTNPGYLLPGPVLGSVWL